MDIQVSVKRVVLALISALVATVLLLGVAASVRLHEVGDRIRSDVEAELRTGEPAWQGRLEAWEFAAAVEPFALASDRPGNTAARLWPNGFGAEPLRCPYVYPAGVDSPGWSRDRERVRAAASCGQLDAFVEAAQVRNFDVLAPAVRQSASVERLRFDTRAYFGIYTGIGALLSRARLRQEDGDAAGAEQDLRAAIALGLKLVRFSPNQRGLEYGHQAIEHGLQHLEAFKSSRGETATAERIAVLLDRLPPREGCRGLIKTDMPQTAAVPVGFAPVAAVVRRTRVPLAIRLGALQGIAHGYTLNPKELVFGPGAERRAIAHRVAREASLEIWWEDMNRVRPPVEFWTTQLFSMLM